MFRIVLLLAWVSWACATQLQDRELQSPINGKMFKVQTVPYTALTFREAAANPADMKTDDDGCRHVSGLSEYHYYLATDPWSYFTAMTQEWSDRAPHFKSPLPAEFKAWLVSKDGLNSEWVTERQQIYNREREMGRRVGRELPPLTEWMMPQEVIPIERRYQLAIKCYQQRGARDAFMAKIALSGAWALRVDFCRPLFDPDLGPGVGEVNDKMQKLASDSLLGKGGKAAEYDVAAWREVYRRIFYDTSLSDEAYYVAGSTYLGFVLRDGDLVEQEKVIELIDKRYKEKNTTVATKVRGLLYDRKRLLRDYQDFLRLAAGSFVRAIQNEEIARPQLLTTVFAVAECLRRSGRYDDAWDWYLTASRFDETDPVMRAQIRAQNGAPSVEAGFPVHLGWMADGYLERLKLKHQVLRGDQPSGVHGPLLNAMLNGGLGTPDFTASAWRPEAGAPFDEARAQLDRLGKTLLDHYDRLGTWPAKLSDLWMSGVIPDWNAVNRFHDPASGKPYLYEVPSKRLGLPVVLLALPEAIRTNQGQKFGAYLLDNTLYWSDTSLVPGQAVER